MTAIATATTTPFLVVFGRDKGGKPHASWFDQASADLARKAAVLMEMHAVPVESGPLRELAGTLPRGRVFASGKAFTPFINGKLYARLLELTREALGLGPTEATPAAKTPSGTAQSSMTANENTGNNVTQTRGTGRANEAGSTTPRQRPTRSEDIGIGSLVLVTPGPTEGWWEAEVIGSNGALLTLRFCDYNEPTVVRRRNELGFLPASGG